MLRSRMSWHNSLPASQARPEFVPRLGTRLAFAGKKSATLTAESLSERPPRPAPAGGTIHPAPAQRFIDRLLQPSLVLAEDWEALPPRVQRRVLECKEEPK